MPAAQDARQPVDETAGQTASASPPVANEDSEARPQARSNSGLNGVEQARRARLQLATTSTPLTVCPPKPLGPYALAGPFTHRNLCVYLVSTRPTQDGKRYALLEQALADQRVMIHETGQVNELAVENVSDAEIFIQAGDIVKGGRQDRVLAYDLVLAPHSGKVPIASFCVEQGRWSQRAGESAGHFSESSAMLASKEGKYGCRGTGGRSQGAVWQSVEEVQGKLGTRLNKDVRAPQSATSLQLTLEDRDLKAEADTYVKALETCVAQAPEATGMVFAINGQLNAADLYASKELFRQLWPRMLKAAAIEATSDFAPGVATSAPGEQAVSVLLDPPPSPNGLATELSDHLEEVSQEYGGHLMLETRVRAHPEQWVRRSYLAKSP